MKHPPVALGAILCTYALEQWAQANSTLIAAYPTLTNYVTGLILVLALGVSLFRNGSVFRGYPAVGWVILLLFVYALVSVVWSVYRPGTIQQWVKHWPYIMTVVVLSPLLIREPRDLQTGLYATLTLGTVVVLLLFWTTETSARGIVLQPGVSGGAFDTSSKGNPLAIASLAGYVVLVAMLLNFSGASRFWQVLRWFLFAIGLALVVRSGSRGQFAALCLAGLVFLPISRQATSMKGFVSTFLGVFLVCGLMLWAASDVVGRGRWQWDDAVDSFYGGRVNTSATLLSYWLEGSPVYWLIGLGNSASFDPQIIGHYPHLMAAEILAEEGLFGLILLGVIVALAARCFFRAYPFVSAYADARGILTAIAALLVFELLVSFKQGSMLTNTYVFAFAIMLGKFELAIQRQQAHAAAHAPPPAITPPHPPRPA